MNDRITQALLATIAALLLVLVLRGGSDDFHVDPPPRFNGHELIPMDPDMRAILEQIRNTLLDLELHAERIEVEMRGR